MSKMGRTIIERLTEFTEALESRDDLSARFTCRKVALNLEPTRYNSKLVKQTRRILGASQAIFARFLGVSVDAVQAWEQGDHAPSQLAARFMDEIRHNPNYWRQRFSEVAVARRNSAI
ncbi:MAG: transcriptional regulator [Planctomycetia bacterium]|nr:transcriptional regulator [Planctomycetia bacterium]